MRDNDIELQLYKKFIKPNLSYIIDIKFDEQCKYIAYSDNGNNLNLFNINSGENLYEINLWDNSGFNSDLSPILFTSDSMSLIYRNNQINILNLNDLSVQIISDKDTSNQFTLSYFKNLLFYSSITEQTEIIKVFDIKNLKFIKNIILDEDNEYINIEVMVISKDNKLLAVACSDLIIRIIDLETFEVRKYLSGHKNDIKSMIFSNNGNYLISGADKEELAFFWNAKTWKLEKKFGNYDETWSGVSCDYNEMNHNGLSITSDNKYLIISTRNKFKITFLDTGTMEIVKEIKDLKYVKDVAISSDGKYIAYSDDFDGTVKIFELEIK